jgi:hypothetical protein
MNFNFEVLDALVMAYRLTMELDLQSLFALHVRSCTH